MTIEKVSRTIELLENIDPDHEYAYEEAFRLFLGLGGLPAIVHRFHREIMVFRTRTHDDDVLFTEFKDVINPPGAMVKGFARCNRPFQSKFYGSENRPTSFMELVYSWCQNKKPGEFLYTTIGGWLIKSPIETLIVVNPNKEERITDFDKYHGDHYDEMVKRFPEEIQRVCNGLYRYLFEKFRKVAYDDPLVYIITSAYCNAALSTTEARIDAICYPSVPFMEQGLNFAFNQSFIEVADIQLELAMRNKFQVGINAEGKFEFTETEDIHPKGIDNIAKTISW